MNPIIAVVISVAVAGLGWMAKALTRSGFLAAVVIGTVVTWSTGAAGLVALGAFFVSSTAVSRLAHRRHPDGDQAATEVRDHWQVLANGGAAAAGGLAEWWQPGLGVWLATIGLAAAASDTWSTALGRLGAQAPRDILTGRPVAIGASGGVTWLGTLGGAVGAAIVALAAAVATRDWSFFAGAAGLGFAGMLFDSVLGSFRQAKFWCPRCSAATERRVHRCGTAAQWRAGWRWMDNNAVNAVATASAVAAGLVAA